MNETLPTTRSGACCALFAAATGSQAASSPSRADSASSLFIHPDSNRPFLGRAFAVHYPVPSDLWNKGASVRPQVQPFFITVASSGEFGEADIPTLMGLTFPGDLRRRSSTVHDVLTAEISASRDLPSGMFLLSLFGTDVTHITDKQSPPGATLLYAPICR